MTIAINNGTGERLTKDQYFAEIKSCIAKRLNEEPFFERYLKANFSMTEVFNFTEDQKIKAKMDFVVFVNEVVLDYFERGYTLEEVENTEN